MRLFIYDDVRYLLTSYTEEAVKDFHRQLPQIKSDIRGMRDSQSNDQKWFNRKGNWVIKEVHGTTTVVFYSKTSYREAKKKLTLDHKSEFNSYVLLVELGTSPGGFAVFEPSAEGDAPNGAGNINLKLTGWTNILTANEDPLGIVDQTTFRAGWCNSASSNPSNGVVQVKRVDQSYKAYTGDDEIPEVTKLGFYSDLWTYEGIIYTTHWQAVDPGPPDPAFCGYTWAPEPAYGGSAADFHDLRHLFYSVELTTVPTQLIAWQPAEFNQLITIHQYWREEGALFIYPHLYDGILDSVEDIGFEAALGSELLPSSYTQIDVDYDGSKRVFGFIWGNVYYPAEDHNIHSPFPYTSFSEMQLHKRTTVSDYARIYLDEYGVHVFGAASEFFINGLERYASGAAVGNSYYYKGTKREVVLEADRFVPESYPRDPLTENQVTLLEGNESSLSWEYDYYTDLWEFESPVRWEFDLGAIMVNCGGSEFFITSVTGAYPTKKTGWFTDYGIFTKKDTGITGGLVDSTTIEPIYAYSVILAEYDMEYGYWSLADQIIYGMVIDGKHYRTEAFPYSPADDSAEIPGLEDARDINRTPISPTPNVRIGYKVVINTTPTTETEYGTE